MCACEWRGQNTIFLTWHHFVFQFLKNYVEFYLPNVPFFWNMLYMSACTVPEVIIRYVHLPANAQCSFHKSVDVAKASSTLYSPSVRAMSSPELQYIPRDQISLGRDTGLCVQDEPSSATLTHAWPVELVVSIVCARNALWLGVISRS